MKRLALTFVTLNALDLTMTLAMLAAGGTELNPVMRLAFEQPVWVPVLAKTLLPAILATWLLVIGQHRALKVVTVAIGCVCLFNVIGVMAGL